MFCVIEPEFKDATDFILKIPDAFSVATNVLHAQRNTIKEIPYKDWHFIIKSFGVPNFFNRLIYSLFRASKACRSFQNAQKLLQAGVRTAAPVAFMEKKSFGILGASYFVALKVEYDFDFHAVNFEKVSVSEDLFYQFAEFTYQMHQAGFLHLDYTPGNILVTKEGSKFLFTIIDINRMHVGSVSWVQGAKSLGKIYFKEPWNTLVAKRYAELVGRSESEVLFYMHQTRASFERKKRWKAFFRRQKRKTSV